MTWDPVGTPTQRKTGSGNWARRRVVSPPRTPRGRHESDTGQKGVRMEVWKRMVLW